MLTNLIRTGALVPLMFCLMPGAFAADVGPLEPKSGGHGAATEKSAASYDLAGHAVVRSSIKAAAATGVAEVFRGVIVEPGKTISLDSEMDFTSAGSVAITIQCGVCTTAAKSLGMAGLVLQARWAVPDAEFSVATEAKAATTFPYWDAGGAVFGVYGPVFRLTLQNKGTETITLQQVTMFRRTL